MSFVKKTPPPPECEEGDIFKAKLTEIKKVTSQLKDQEGNLREQLEIDFELVDNGYKGRTWMAYYEQPGDKSMLGKLALKLQQVTKHEINDIQVFLREFKTYGYIFVKVKGFREYEGETFPNFGIVADKLPGMQEKLAVSEKEKTRDMRPVLEPFKDAITLGFPLNQSDFNKSLMVDDRLTLFKQGFIEEKQGLYYFTDKARALFQG